MPVTLGNPTSELSNKFVMIRDKDETITGIKTFSSPGAIVAGDLRIGHEWRKTVVIADSAVKTLPTADITLVSAPGTNMVITLNRLLLRLKYTASYTNIDNGASLRVKRGSTVISEALFNNNGQSITELTTFLTGSKLVQLLGLKNFNATLGPYPKVLTYGSNEALLLSLDNAAAGNLTGGDIANELIATVYYSIFDYTGL